MKNANSIKNQEIKGQFVAREVKTCFSYEMDAILKAEAKDLPTWEDVENLYGYRCPDCGEVVRESVTDDTRANGGHIFNCTSCEYTAPDTELCDEEPQEIFEWWIVTEWLYEKLKAKGEPVLEWGCNYYWGRTCTGQAILLDGVITDICADLEILEGQKNEWK